MTGRASTEPDSEAMDRQVQLAVRQLRDVAQLREPHGAAGESLALSLYDKGLTTNKVSAELNDWLATGHWTGGT
ncbi:hypothetical protein [Streptomyces sp. NPDC002133]|uniref:hypothetical protein n=1 Tax=Streptomyces sp. NPDC002133 TaxID=3154409 RepID=UPI0033176595